MRFPAARTKRAAGDSPRVLVVSPRHYETAVYRCGQVEFEDVICAVDDVALVAPPRLPRGGSRVARRAARMARRLAGIELSFLPQPKPVKIEQDYDLLFVYARSLEDLAILDAVPGARAHCAKAVCVLEELWAATLPLQQRQFLDRLAQFDLVAVQFEGTVDALSAHTGVRCEWVPPGVDAIRFFPGRKPPPRTIDLFAMGRRSEDSHRVLLEHASRHGWTYLFDTVDPFQVREGVHDTHRVQLAELVKRSRYFIANKARVDNPDVTGPQEELGFRSFEGAAGGAILLGDTPNNAGIHKLFDWPDAHIYVPFGSPELVDVMARLDAEPQRVQRIRRDNIVNSLRRHDWAHRWQRLLALVDLPPTEGLLRRLLELEALASGASQQPEAAIPPAAASDHIFL